MGAIIAKLMDWLEKIFKFIFSDWKNFIIFALLIVGTIFFFKYKSAVHELEEGQTNVTDSLTTYKNKIGELYVQQNTYVMDIKELKKKNSELAQEVKNLKDNPIIVTKIKTVTEIKEIHVKDTVTIDTLGRYTLPMNYQDQWCLISGRSTIDTKLMIGESVFDTISFPNNITIDLIEKNKQLSFIAKSDNPYCQINSLNGSVLSPEKSDVLKKRFDKKWAVVAGVGPTLTVVDGKIKLVPGVQITLGYKLFGF